MGKQFRQESHQSRHRPSAVARKVANRRNTVAALCQCKVCVVVRRIFECVSITSGRTQIALVTQSKLSKDATRDTTTKSFSPLSVDISKTPGVFRSLATTRFSLSDFMRRSVKARAGGERYVETSGYVEVLMIAPKLFLLGYGLPRAVRSERKRQLSVSPKPR